jgi:hypothetical protein
MPFGRDEFGKTKTHRTVTRRTVTHRAKEGFRRVCRLLLRLATPGRFAPLARIVVCALLAWHACAGRSWSQSAFHDDHESAAAAWQPAGADTRYRVERQARVQDRARSGPGCEMISYSAGVGSFVYFAYPVGQARVIDELRPTVWMKANRPGLQVLARIVLPRTQDPKTGSAVTVLVRGSSYTQVDQWQMLAVEGLPKALDEQVRVLRARIGRDVDPREAYVDQVVVNLYGGQGATTVWLDDLDVAGFVGKRPDQTQADVAIAEAKLPDDKRRNASRVQFENDVLLVGGRPFFPRMIEYRGERLGELAQLGFNTIWLRRPASVELIGDARRAGLWVICAPPDKLPAEFDDRYDGVLAWNLGHHLAAAELDAVTQLAAELRKRDAARQRPLVAQPDSQLRGYSRVIDILLIDRPVLGTSLELADYARYVSDRPQLARPGTPFWAAVDLDLEPRLVRQIEAVAGGRLRTKSFDAPAVRQAAFVVLSAGARGLLFNTHDAVMLRERRVVPPAPNERELAEPREVVSVRAMAFALFNRELQMCEPWLAEGQRAAVTRDRDSQATLAVMQSRRGKLLLATRVLPGGQFAPGAMTNGSLSLVTPGSLESHDAFVLSAAGLRALDARRVAGGSSLSWDGFGACGSLVMTADPLLVTTLNRQTQSSVRATAAYKLESMRLALVDAELVARQIGVVTVAVPNVTVRNASVAVGNSSNNAQAKPRANAEVTIDPLAIARMSMLQAERFFAAGDAVAAYRAADAAGSSVALWQRAAWEQVVRGWPSPVSSPLAVTPLTLVEQSQLAGRVERAVVGRNSLAAGDCESLPAMVEAGWKHWQHAQSGIETHVELSPVTPFEGQSSLYLAATTSDAELAGTLIETPPVWVVSAPAQFAADTGVRIRGRVRIAKPITGSVDGLEIIDSLGGPALATRIGQAAQWQEFTLYRHARRDELITITFALTGLGEAWIDNVVVEPMALPAGRDLLMGGREAAGVQDAAQFSPR